MNPHKPCSHDELKWGRKLEVIGGREITVCGRCREEITVDRSSDAYNDHADMLDAVALLKRWTRKYPDTDLGLKTLDWLKRRNFRPEILRTDGN
jgi:hypothetical protein